jgi:2-oxoisovalerate dehydrogenase E1 component
MGEDIHSPYGGAFKVAKGLSDRYPNQVLTTPISEACIVGLGCGLALMGTMAVVEIMFGDFMTLAFDQILNHAAKFRQMYGGKRNIPLLIRTPMGGGRGYGPTHSQSLEKHFAGIPGINLFILHGRTRVFSFYQALLSRSDMTSIVIEHKLLYPRQSDRTIAIYYTLYETNEIYPTTILKHSEDPDITLVAFGNMTLLAEEVASTLYEDEEIVVELIFPLQIYPMNSTPILESVKKTKRLVVLEEGVRGFDLGSEVIAEIASKWTNQDAFRVRRVAAVDMALPSAIPLEKLVLPSVSELFKTCVEIFEND